MKKLTKLDINPERILRNEDLLILRGGESGTCGYTYRMLTAEYDEEGVAHMTTQTYTGCGVSYGDVYSYRIIDGIQDFHWCCDSCSTTSYCGS